MRQLDTVLVTGCAGFIGSQLSEELLASGVRVVGIDNLSDYYSTRQKEQNLVGQLGQPLFTFHRQDILEADLDQLLSDVDVVFHQAGQPGVRSSWREGFDQHVDRNVVATQRLLESAARSERTRKFVYASSSSVYGNSPTYPTMESQLPRPESPYGVTKLAGEQLVSIYGRMGLLDCVSLRYFTVFGPRQRPDMAIHRLIRSAALGTEFTLFGDGSFERDFTYVGDIVAANMLAATEETRTSAVYNVGGNQPVSMKELIRLVEEVTGAAPNITYAPVQAGDVRRTGASLDMIRGDLGWRPQTDLRTALGHEWDWFRETQMDRH
jgi:UDP-glucuronate 4-epimerase